MNVVVRSAATKTGRSVAHGGDRRWIRSFLYHVSRQFFPCVSRLKQNRPIAIIRCRSNIKTKYFQPPKAPCVCRGRHGRRPPTNTRCFEPFSQSPASVADICRPENEVRNRRTDLRNRFIAKLSLPLYHTHTSI